MKPIRNFRFQALVQSGHHAIGLADHAVGDNLARRVNRARHSVGRGGRLPARSQQLARSDRLPAEKGRGGAGEERVGHPRDLRVPIRAGD